MILTHLGHNDPPEVSQADVSGDTTVPWIRLQATHSYGGAMFCVDGLETTTHPTKAQKPPWTVTLCLQDSLPCPGMLVPVCHKQGWGQDQPKTKTGYQNGRNILLQAWLHFKQDVNANSTAWLSGGFWLSEFWRFENHWLLLSKKRRAKGLAMEDTGRHRRGDPLILSQSLT